MSGDQTTIASVSPTDARAKLRGIVDAFPGKRFAVIDGGHFEDLPALFKKTGLFARSLFLDTADVAVQAAGPWLVQLDQSPEATDAVFTLVGDKPAVVFWCCADGEMVLWRHLRGLNMARIPIWAANGENNPPVDAEPTDTYDLVMFRHWDPRVFGALMPVLDAAQFSRILGPSFELAFYSEEFGGCRRILADKRWMPATPGFVTIRSKQIELLTARRVDASHHRIALYLRDVAPQETSHMSDESLHALIVESKRVGKDLGLESEQAHGRWAYVMARTNGRALEQPGLYQYITDGRIHPDEKMSWLLKSMAAMEARMTGGGS